MKADSPDRLAIRLHDKADRGALVDLWRVCNLVVAHNPPEGDIALCEATASCALFVGEYGARMAASVMAGNDGHRGWLYYLAVHPDFRRRGFGRAMVRHAESWLGSLGVRKVHLMVRPTNIGVREFYERIGYDTNPCPVLQKWLVEPAA